MASGVCRSKARGEEEFKNMYFAFRRCLRRKQLNTLASREMLATGVFYMTVPDPIIPSLDGYCAFISLDPITISVMDAGDSS